jgi:hypothetical protein
VGLELDAVFSNWPVVVDAIQGSNRRIAALLKSVEPVAVRDRTVILYSPYDFHRARVGSPEVSEVVRGTLAEFFGEPLYVEVLASVPAQIKLEEELPF